ncbi:MAG: restriction endonuclease, partial [Candidatus Heimdallarchaeota archaeon]|nr:restriction endonuclease [Candidatus Heimdallarchaeota archaeon]
SAGRSATEMIRPSNTIDTSSLLAYLSNIGQLTKSEFKEMVVEVFKHKGWKDIKTTLVVTDERWNITGLDETGGLTYVKVNSDENGDPIDLPTVQAFHSVKMSRKALRAIFIANSEFTDQATEYALEVKIELINKKKLREMGQHILDGAPQSDKRTRPINNASLKLELQQFVDRSMFSFPEPPSTFIATIIPSTITFSPLQFYQFKLWHQFTNTTRSWIWDMNYPDNFLVDHLIQNWLVVEKQQQSEYTDLEPLTKALEEEGLQCSINPAPQIKKLSDVKAIIKQVTTTTKFYKDQSNQKSSQTCTADMADIEVLTSATYWSSCMYANVIIGQAMEYQFQLHEGKVSQVLSQNQNKDGNILDKTTVVCQECHTLAAPAKYFRNLTYCSACGKVLCEKCGHKEGKHWCSDCWEKINAGKQEKKQNKELIKKLKQAFHEWQIC